MKASLETVTEFEITYRGTVYPWHCDHMGHMNVMWYSGKFDEASWQFLSKLGLSRAHFREYGAGMAAVEQNIKYQCELHAGDIVSIRSKVMEINEKSIRILHEMTNDESGIVAAVSEIVGVYLDTKIRKARALPHSVRERALAFMAEGPVGARQSRSHQFTTPAIFGITARRHE